MHPTFLYESLWNLIGFIILNALYKKKKFDGEIFGGYCIWYGFGRMLIEGLRTDSLMLGPIRISQLVGFASCLFGIVFCVIRAKQTAKAKNAETEYTAIYDKAVENAEQPVRTADVDTADTTENAQSATENTSSTEKTEDDHGTDH